MREIYKLSYDKKEKENFMFDYTKAAGVMILEDLKKWRNNFQIFFSLFTLGYLAYCLIRQVGIFYINLALSVLYVAYTVFQLVTLKRNNKKLKKRVARTYKWARLLLKTLTLASTLYGIYVASTAVDGISLILATLTIIIWVIQVLLEVLTVIIEPKIRLLTAGLVEDTKTIVPALNKMHIIEFKLDPDNYKKEIAIIEKRVVIDHAMKAMAKKEKRKLLAVAKTIIKPKKP